MYYFKNINSNLNEKRRLSFGSQQITQKFPKPPNNNNFIIVTIILFGFHILNNTTKK